MSTEQRERKEGLFRKLLGFVPFVPSGNPNPGPFDALNQEIGSITPEPFDGLKVEFSKSAGLPGLLSTNTMITGSQVMPASHLLGISYVGKEFQCALRGNRSRVISGRLQRSIGENAGVRVQGQYIPSEGAHAVADIDVQYGDWAAQLKAGVDGLFGAQFIQSLSSGIALGAEAFHSMPRNITAFTVAGRHRSEAGHTGVLTVSSLGHVSGSYVHKISERVAIGTQFEANIPTKDSIATLGYHVALKDTSVKGQLDTRGHMCTVVEERIAEGVSLLLSGDLNHKKGSSAFGIALAIGQ